MERRLSLWFSSITFGIIWSKFVLLIGKMDNLKRWLLNVRSGLIASYTTEILPYHMRAKGYTVMLVRFTPTYVWLLERLIDNFLNRECGSLWCTFLQSICQCHRKSYPSKNELSKYMLTKYTNNRHLTTSAGSITSSTAASWPSSSSWSTFSTWKPATCPWKKSSGTLMVMMSRQLRMMSLSMMRSVQSYMLMIVRLRRVPVSRLSKCLFSGNDAVSMPGLMKMIRIHSCIYFSKCTIKERQLVDYFAQNYHQQNKAGIRCCCKGSDNDDTQESRNFIIFLLIA